MPSSSRLSPMRALSCIKLDSAVVKEKLSVKAGGFPAARKVLPVSGKALGLICGVKRWATPKPLVVPEAGLDGDATGSEAVRSTGE